MPRTPWVITLISDPAEAQARLAGLVECEPEALSVVASVTRALVADPSRHVGARWWAATDPSGQVVGAFMHTPPHPLHVALASTEVARALASLLAEEGDRLPGVSGQREPAEAFAEEWAARTGARSSVVMQMGRFALPTPARLPFEVSGSFRTATPADTPLVDEWHEQFIDAIEGPGSRAAAPLTEHMSDGRVGLWQDRGRPVSMAYASPASGGVTRISGVWTPPELRGHGYASAVVVGLSTARQSEGEKCVLYTDLANPTSNAIYQAIGYRRIGDGITLTFSA